MASNVVFLLALLAVSFVFAAIPKSRSEDATSELASDQKVYRSSSNIMQDILAQIGHLTKDNRDEYGDADEVSRFYGEILDEYRKKFGFPRMEPRKPYQF